MQFYTNTDEDIDTDTEIQEEVQEVRCQDTCDTPTPAPPSTLLSVTIVGYANDFHPIHGLSLSAFHGTFE